MSARPEGGSDIISLADEDAVKQVRARDAATPGASEAKMGSSCLTTRVSPPIIRQ
jgi:hypothetical protein